MLSLLCSERTRRFLVFFFRLEGVCTGDKVWALSDVVADSLRRLDCDDDGALLSVKSPRAVECIDADPSADGGVVPRVSAVQDGPVRPLTGVEYRRSGLLDLAMGEIFSKLEVLL